MGWQMISATKTFVSGLKKLGSMLSIVMNEINPAALMAATAFNQKLVFIKATKPFLARLVDTAAQPWLAVPIS
jgi:hypothetical protein